MDEEKDFSDKEKEERESESNSQTTGEFLPPAPESQVTESPSPSNLSEPEPSISPSAPPSNELTNLGTAESTASPLEEKEADLKEETIPPSREVFSQETTPPPIESLPAESPATGIPEAPPASSLSPASTAPGKKSRKWWILGGCGGCGCLVLIALLTFFLLGGGLSLFGSLHAPVKAVEEHLLAVTNGDFSRAYTYLSQELQKEIDLTSYTDFVKSHPENYEGIEKINASSVNIKGNEAQAEGKVIYKDGLTASFEATLIKEGNFWKIKSLWVKPKDK